MRPVPARVAFPQAGTCAGRWLPGRVPGFALPSAASRNQWRMAKKAYPLRRVAVLCLLLACGFVAGRMLKPRTTEPGPAAMGNFPPTPRQQSPAATPGDAPPPVTINLRSTDTLADLLNLAPEDLYERLALWLVDAGADDMKAYWEATRDQEGLNFQIRDLLFIQWTQLDPLGAIQAASGTPSSHIPWWAWAKHDSAAAFEHAMTHDRSRIEIVLRAIGQSDPKRALKLLRDHPDLPQTAGADGILFGLIRDDPEAAAKLAHATENHHDARPIQAWLRRDPHAAFDWYLANRSVGDPFSSNKDQEIIKTLAAGTPELLEEFAAKLPHGDFRRQLEGAAFDQLLRKDPAKALEQSRRNPSPLIAAEQRSKVALHLLESDPQQAKSLFAEILKDRPDLTIQEITTRFPNGSSGSGDTQMHASQLMQRLIATDPQGTLDQLVAANPEGSMNHTTQQAASQWVAIDPDGFAAWTASQSDPAIRDRSYQLLVYRLNEFREFEAAIRYAGNLDPTMRDLNTSQILRQWQQFNPTAAAAWAEANGVNLEPR